MQNLVRFLRETWNTERQEHGDEPLSDARFINRLIQAGLPKAAEEAARQHYQEEERW